MKRDLMVDFKQLRLHGMAGAWSDLVEQGTNTDLDASRWLLEQSWTPGVGQRSSPDK